MGMTNGRTICSKHDEIKTLSERLANYLSMQDSVPSFSDYEVETLEDVIENSEILQRFLGLLKDDADTIFHLADNAKSDGQSMENGLDTKREEITSLESQISDLKADARELSETLEEAKSRIAYLESLLENTNA
jgi:peptidoglycan hydrolase CwlO-like protein